MKDYKTWFRANRADVLLDLLRIYLGIGLFIRGILFVSDTSALSEWLTQANELHIERVAIMHYVALTHIGGGILLALGMATRLGAILQLPILIGAVFFIHLPAGLGESGQSLEFSVLVLFLLVLFAIRGSVVLSVDTYKTPTPAESEARWAWLEPYLAHPEEDVEPSLEGETAVAVKPATSSAVTCSCGHTIESRWVSPYPEYSTFRMILLVLGSPQTPKAIEFRCRKCGEVIARTTDRQTLIDYRMQRLV